MEKKGSSIPIIWCFVLRKIVGDFTVGLVEGKVRGKTYRHHERLLRQAQDRFQERGRNIIPMYSCPAGVDPGLLNYNPNIWIASLRSQ